MSKSTKKELCFFPKNTLNNHKKEQKSLFSIIKLIIKFAIDITNLTSIKNNKEKDLIEEQKRYIDNCIIGKT